MPFHPFLCVHVILCRRRHTFMEVWSLYYCARFPAFCFAHLIKNRENPSRSSNCRPKKYQYFSSHLLSSSGWTNNQINRTRLTGENQHLIHVHGENSPKHAKSIQTTKTVRQHWLYKTFWEEEKNGESDFRSENG